VRLNDQQGRGVVFDILQPNHRQLLAAAGASLIAPAGLGGTGQAALPPVKEEDALIAFGHTGSVAVERWT